MVHDFRGKLQDFVVLGALPHSVHLVVALGEI
jgi:hypothetical protein